MQWIGYQDMDLHCLTPDGQDCSFGNKKLYCPTPRASHTAKFCKLDIDHRGKWHGKKYVPGEAQVENILISKTRAPPGKYVFKARLYNGAPGANLTTVAESGRRPSGAAS